jgi:uncharacterized protein
MVQVGLISDTHGLLRKEAAQALAGSELILHAGDVGGTGILTALSEIAPVIAVRGNIDEGAFSEALPRSAVAETGGLRIYVLHNISELAFDPAEKGFHVVVFGHSHKPSRREKKSVLFINPGSAGPQRFHLPVSVANLKIDNQRCEVRFTDLLTGKPLKI